MEKVMTGIIEKISSYNIFNYLFPGVVFSVISEQVSNYKFLHEDIIVGMFYYYFIGLVVSRFGSLVVEPALKKMSLLHYSDYQKFVAASQKDSKIEILVEVSNMYRTLCALFFLIILLVIYSFFEGLFPFLIIFRLYLLLIFLFLMFLLSFKKQSNYVSKRVDANS